MTVGELKKYLADFKDEQQVVIRENKQSIIEVAPEVVPLVETVGENTPSEQAAEEVKEETKAE
jgi:hypothetical protein